MANILTISRIVLTLPLLCLPVLSDPFAVLYVIAGLTDMLDGAIARKTGTVSKVGAKLDTAADFVFTVVCLMKLLPIIELPLYLLIWTAVIAAIKLVNILSGFVVQGKFVTVHSILKVIDNMSDETVENSIDDIANFKLSQSINNLDTAVYFFHGTAANEMLAKKSSKYVRKHHPNTTVKCFKGKFHCENALFNPEIMIAELDKIFDK